MVEALGAVEAEDLDHGEEHHMLEVMVQMGFKGKLRRQVHVVPMERMVKAELTIHRRLRIVFREELAVVAAVLVVVAAAAAAAAVVVAAAAAAAVATIQGRAYLVDRAELAVRAVSAVGAALEEEEDWAAVAVTAAESLFFRHRACSPLARLPL